MLSVSCDVFFTAATDNRSISAHFPRDVIQMILDPTDSTSTAPEKSVRAACGKFSTKPRAASPKRRWQRDVQSGGEFTNAVRDPLRYGDARRVRVAGPCRRAQTRVGHGAMTG
jgi:hypothetical protein